MGHIKTARLDQVNQTQHAMKKHHPGKTKPAHQGDCHIKFCQLGFRFDDRRKYSIEDISLQVEQGEVLLLAGRSGSGKSTLLNCLNGLIPEYYPGTMHGRIRINGDATSWRDIPLWKKATVTGTVFQDPRHQFFSARVEQEIMLSLWRDAAPLADKQKKVEAILKRLGLAGFSHRLLDDLSSGEQQRVAIGSVLSAGPGILLLDEPSANLSEDGISALQQFLRQAKQSGTTVIIVDHRFFWLRSLVDYLVVLDQGTIVYQGNADKLDDPVFCENHGLRYHVRTEDGENVGKNIGRKKDPADVLCILDHLGYRYRKQSHWLFRRLNFIVNRGEVMALAGRNGCGKTTLLGLIYGLHKPVEGMIDFPGDRPTMALALQHPDLQLFASTVSEEVKKDGEAGEKWLERFDLWPLRHRHPLTLSGGEMQRLVLAVAFAALPSDAPGLLLLDEPTSGMDGHHLRILGREIQKLREQKHGVVMATHDDDLIRLSGATSTILASI